MMDKAGQVTMSKSIVCRARDFFLAPVLRGRSRRHLEGEGFRCGALGWTCAVRCLRVTPTRRRLKELEFGALAWRSAGRCINLRVRHELRLVDRRDHEASAKNLFEGMLEHLRVVWNGGASDAATTVFAPNEPGRRGVEFVLPQLHGSPLICCPRSGHERVLGDPAKVTLTRLCVLVV